MRVTYQEYPVNVSEALLDPSACVVRFDEPTPCLSDQGMDYTGKRSVETSVCDAINEIRTIRKAKGKSVDATDIELLLDFQAIHYGEIICKMILEQED